MTGLMMIFMLISIIFMVEVDASRDRLRGVAERYNNIRESLYADLMKEFASDLPRWHAKLDPDLAIRFEEPNVLFDTGRADLKQRFIDILDNFFPRYVKIISSKKYRDSIVEIRVEGHTSSVWAAESDPDEAYFRNMELSQSRTRSTLQHVLLLQDVKADKPWLTQKLTANGLSSSRLIRDKNGRENIEASQRVEFRVRTDAESKLGEILREKY
jgi:outer membrane protein OmpA-like peptidoglycan-associated protein